jgi:S-adenosylhomocysteine hydrolase
VNEWHKPEKALFARSPLLDAFIEHSLPKSEESLKGIALVCVQHFLETTGTLIESLLKLGLSPENVFAAGKVYSTNPDVERRLKGLGVHVQPAGVSNRWGYYEDQLRADVVKLWETATRHVHRNRIRKVIILDDGGCALSTVPEQLLLTSNIAGVEQTMSGIALQTSGRVAVPVVEVATSAAKRLIEPFLIQKAVFRRLMRSASALAGKGRCGIIGYGNIGKAVSDALLRSNKDVLVFDSSGEALTAARSRSISTTKDLQELVTASDVVFGCAGQDTFTETDWWKQLSSEKIFVSCSSLDLEFRTLLRSIGKISQPVARTILQDVPVNANMLILQGGFPINFDRSRESVPLAEIQLTRALLFAGVLQAASVAERGDRGFSEVPLLASFQHSIVNRWFSLDERRPAFYTPSVQQIFQSIELIERHSSLANQLLAPGVPA